MYNICCIFISYCINTRLCTSGQSNNVLCDDKISERDQIGKCSFRKRTGSEAHESQLLTFQNGLDLHCKDYQYYLTDLFLFPKEVASVVFG